ncbi:hypothetical protein [Methylomonas sp. CM2]|uniref:hypothetical protein n=1 Tax=Methylomonas sp. CM2 TaxID=3417647 RepID=UPI003CF67DA3
MARIGRRAVARSAEQRSERAARIAAEDLEREQRTAARRAEARERAPDVAAFVDRLTEVFGPVRVLAVRSRDYFVMNAEAMRRAGIDVETW